MGYNPTMKCSAEMRFNKRTIAFQRKFTEDKVFSAPSLEDDDAKI